MAKFELVADISKAAYALLKKDTRFNVTFLDMEPGDSADMHLISIQGKKQDIYHMVRTLASPRKLLLRELAELIHKKIENDDVNWSTAQDVKFIYELQGDT
tara:strand:+ start:5578 stop:5880 length:303 start_codon:yes stop_codon:yes gene_type:complete